MVFLVFTFIQKADFSSCVIIHLSKLLVICKWLGMARLFFYQILMSVCRLYIFINC